MEQRPLHPFRRALAMLLCVAMLASYIVLPVSAEDTGVILPEAGDLKTSVSVSGANYYNAETGVALTYGAWLETLYLDSNYSDTLENFVINKATPWTQKVSLMPAKGSVTSDGNPDANNYVGVTYYEDGSFELTEADDRSGYGYSYGDVTCSLVVPEFTKTLYIYANVTGDSGAHFNVIVHYTTPGGTSTSYAIKKSYLNGQTSGSDLPVSSNTYGYDITGEIPAGSTITRIQYYVSGGNEISATYHDVGLVASAKPGDTTLTSATQTAFPQLSGYTVLVVEHMGGESELFFVDAVIDGEEYSDEYIHQLKAKMEKGFVLYVPDSAWTSGVPSRGDIVTAGWSDSDNVFMYDWNADFTVSWPSTTRSNAAFDATYTLSFYENPTDSGVVKQFTFDATTSVDPLNATVQMFNYDANINHEDNPLNFWNGYWGHAGEVESVNGSGVEQGIYGYPNVSPVLGSDGYPVFYNYVVDNDNGTYYKTTDGKYLLVSKADAYADVIYDTKYDDEGAEAENGAYYKRTDDTLVKVSEADLYKNVIKDTTYSVDTEHPVSLGYLFGADANSEEEGVQNAPGVTAYPEMTNGGGLFRHDPDTGNYFYDSMQNAAWYDAKNNKFVLYDSLIVRPWYNSVGGDDFDYKADGFNYDKYLKAGYTAGTSVANPESYGNFLPFNEVTADNITLDGAVYEYDENGNRVVSAKNYSATVLAAARAGTLEKFGLMTEAAEKVLAANKSLGSGVVELASQTYQYSKGLYTARLEEDVDMWFGMSVDFDFFQPYNGQTKTATGQVHDMVFDFEGDDDVFVYVGVWNGKDYEYKLVLDIGGAHEARKGLINFATGAVEYQNCNGEKVTTTLGEIFGLDGDTFEDFSKLSLKFFYMERGGNISCCRLSFNLPTLPEDSLTISKALDQNALGSQTYQFRVLKATANEAGVYEPLITKEVLQDYIKDHPNTKYNVSNVAKVDENGYFTLTPGQSITFDDVLTLFGGETDYIVEETIISDDVNGQYTTLSPDCTLNGGNVDVFKDSTITNKHVYRTGVMTLNTSAETKNQTKSSSSNLVGITNLVEEDMLGTLKISKEIKEGAKIDPELSFDMRVKLGGALLPVGTPYTLVKADGTQETKTVTTRGVVTLKADETVYIDRILSTSTFEVTEVSYNASPTYRYNGADTYKGYVTCNNNGATGTMPLGGEISILVINDDSSGLIVDKTVAKGETDKDFVLSLEAFATGQTTTFTSTTPADIVLVLDQSASMYTPVGAESDQYTRDVDQSGNNNLTRVSAADVEKDTAHAKHLGYYVAQRKNPRTSGTLKLYEWYIVQYIDGGWYYACVPNTTASVIIDRGHLVQYAESLNQYNNNADESGGQTVVKAYDSDAGTLDTGLIDEFIYYKSQYAALYDSVNSFVDELKATGVDHRIAITGFSSPFYDGLAYHDGSGLYIDGNYYLYDPDYKYKGIYDGSKYLLYAPAGSDVYTSMQSILPANQYGISWTDKLYDANGDGTADERDLVLLDVTGAFSGNHFAADLTVINKLMSQEDYAKKTATGQYGNALVSVQSGNDSIKNSIEAITTNYQQTCPSAASIWLRKFSIVGQLPRTAKAMSGASSSSCLPTVFPRFLWMRIVNTVLPRMPV